MLTTYFLIDKMIQLPVLAGNYRLTSKTPFKWRFAGVPMMVQHRMLTEKYCYFPGR